MFNYILKSNIFQNILCFKKNKKNSSTQTSYHEHSHEEKVEISSNSSDEEELGIITSPINKHTSISKNETNISWFTHFWIRK
tara:strand:+ start:82 stop:327 length:246 start_codon:yes stop_codon:yes gene_type:complete